MSGAVTAVQVGSSPRCRSCRAPIWWGLTAKGRRMPLDLAPTEDGNVVIERVDALIGIGADDPLPRVRVLRKDDVVGRDTPRYVAHWATCSNPERHRRSDRTRTRNGSKAKARAMGLVET